MVLDVVLYVSVRWTILWLNGINRQGGGGGGPARYLHMPHHSYEIKMCYYICALSREDRTSYHEISLSMSNVQSVLKEYINWDDLFNILLSFT